MITDPPDAHDWTIPVVFITWIIVLLCLVLPEFIRGFNKRRAEILHEERKRAVIKFCRDRGFEPEEDVVDMVLKIKKQ